MRNFLITLFFSSALISCASKTTVYQNESITVKLNQNQGAIVVDKDYIRVLKVEDTLPEDDGFCKKKKISKSKSFIECKIEHSEYYPEKKIELIIFD